MCISNEVKEKKFFTFLYIKMFHIFITFLVKIFLKVYFEIISSYLTIIFFY